MSRFSDKLRTINHPSEAPADAYLLYNMSGGTHYVSPKDYPDFVAEWFGLSQPPPFTLDLASPPTHALVLDLDYRSDQQANNVIFDIIETALKMTLLPALPHFTYIVARRSDRYGLHVHLPELSVSHDDYVLLCDALHQRFVSLNAGAYVLDVPSNWTLARAAKPDHTPYWPCYLVYVDERTSLTFKVSNFKEDYEPMRRKFPKRRNNENSLFRNLLRLNSLPYLFAEMKQLMMPVLAGRVDAPTRTLSYPTFVGRLAQSDPDWKEVATFAFRRTGELGVVSKSPRMVADREPEVFFHLKLNARDMVDFETRNHGLRTWYHRFGRAPDASHIPPFFRELHETLQFEHRSLSEDAHPLRTLMQFSQGYYFLPVFYALCRHYGTDLAAMVGHLRDVLEPAFHPLLEQMVASDPKNVEFATMAMSVNTIHYCADNLHADPPPSNREKLRRVVENNQRAILSATTAAQMAELLRRMQDRHLPILMIKLKNALKKPTRYVFNTLEESWQEVTTDKEVTDHMLNLWQHVKQFLRDRRGSGQGGGPTDEMVRRFQVAPVVSTIMSDTAMERRDIQMDAHRWLLRLQDGVLDLQTGHLGGVVPELFLSDRKIHLGIPRPQMMRLCTDAPELEAVYAKLVDKRHFLRYLKTLLLDEGGGGDLVAPLQPLVPEDADAGLAASMLHFYANLCKCTCFEHDLLLYLLDVLASVLVGTNYERKFFVWKGLTRNGKSKLFELMGRTLGGYYHAIQSENLTPSSGGGSSCSPSPELASTLFSCRMVTSEELEKRLDENRVKQLTGNSFVAFRNMYEQNAGGIPTAKLFVTTNNYPDCRATEAFKDRVVAIPFSAEFTDEAPARVSEQVERNAYPKEAYVVEQSYRGCFLVLYYHLRRHMSRKDGLLHYRQEPESVVEFTQDYLIHTDVYVQFKLQMDVQLRAGYQTSHTDVRSAMRQYLKATKNTSYHETDLFVSFEKEFGHLRQTDIQVPYEAFSYIAEGGSSKKARLETPALVFYDGVVIKNLRRVNLDD